MERAWVSRLDADRLRLNGKEDEGDWWIRTKAGHLWVVQSKARKNLSMPAVLKEAHAQAERYAEHRGLDEVPRAGLLVRPYGLGRARIDEWPFVQRFGQLLERG